MCVETPDCGPEHVCRVTFGSVTNAATDAPAHHRGRRPPRRPSRSLTWVGWGRLVRPFIRSGSCAAEHLGGAPSWNECCPAGQATEGRREATAATPEAPEAPGTSARGGTSADQIGFQDLVEPLAEVSKVYAHVPTRILGHQSFEMGESSGVVEVRAAPATHGLGDRI